MVALSCAGARWLRAGPYHAWCRPGQAELRGDTAVLFFGTQGDKAAGG
jgi:hypothetical protein